MEEPVTVHAQSRDTSGALSVDNRKTTDAAAIFGCKTHNHAKTKLQVKNKTKQKKPQTATTTNFELLLSRR